MHHHQQRPAADHAAHRAGTLNVPWEMLDFKFRIMKKKGYSVNSPYMAQANFLKDFEKHAHYEYDES